MHLQLSSIQSSLLDTRLRGLIDLLRSIPLPSPADGNIETQRIDQVSHSLTLSLSLCTANEWFAAVILQRREIAREKHEETLRHD